MLKSVWIFGEIWKCINICKIIVLDMFNKKIKLCRNILPTILTYIITDKGL